MADDLVAHFSEIDDPRCAGKVEHRLMDVLVIAVCATIAGAESWEDMALYGRSKEAWLRGFLPLVGGIPGSVHGSGGNSARVGGVSGVAIEVYDQGGVCTLQS